mmetsp:Transcript_86438/g.201092  ORF Transcript_86438/g.201092 Transcript_86438/m.201092 type:complete len:214 (+) Transcript_86438:565-1206(+)
MDLREHGTNQEGREDCSHLGHEIQNSMNFRSHMRWEELGRVHPRRTGGSHLGQTAYACDDGERRLPQGSNPQGHGRKRSRCVEDSLTPCATRFVDDANGDDNAKHLCRARDGQVLKVKRDVALSHLAVRLEDSRQEHDNAVVCNPKRKPDETHQQEGGPEFPPCKQVHDGVAARLLLVGGQAGEPQRLLITGGPALNHGEGILDPALRHKPSR